MRLLYVASLVAFLLQAGVNPFPQQGPRASLEGVVTRLGTAQPISKARVTLARQRGMQPPGSSQPIPPVITDDKGRFVFQSLDEGLYEVRAQANGYIEPESSNVELSSGEVIKDLTISLKAVANISGRVHDTADQPLVNVPVQLLRSSFDFRGQHTYKSAGTAQTNDRGEFRMYWVTPGRYYLLAGRPTTGANPFSAMMSRELDGLTASGNEVPPVVGYAFYPGVTEFVNARTLDLQPGADLQIDLALTPRPRTFSIRGKLIDSRTGQPPPRASLLVSTQTPGSDSSAMDRGFPNGNYNAAAGTFQIRDLLPGNYTLSAIVQDPAIAGQRGATAQSTGTVPVTVSAFDVDGVAISLVPAGSIPGRLRIEGQFPATTTVSQFRVVLLPTGPNNAVQQMVQTQVSGVYQGTPVNADGTFRLNNVVPGDYRIEVTFGVARLIGGPNGFIRDARFEGIDVLNSPLRFTGTNSAALDVMVAAGGGKITGAVIDARGQPMPGAQAVLVPDRARHRPDLHRASATDEDGRFNFSAVPPGDYKIFSWESIEEYAWFDPEVLAQSELKGTPVHVSESSTETVSVRIIPTEGTR